TPDRFADKVLQIADVNEAPTAVTLTRVTTSLPENTATPIEVASIAISDDALGANGLSLSGADASSFEIVGNKLRVKPGVSLNYEAKTTYSVRVNVNDPAVDGTPDAFMDFTLGITDVNEAPTGVARTGAVTSLLEHTATPIELATIVIADDALGANQLSLSG